jgi:AhpD family alkylhydroperoxidase
VRLKILDNGHGLASKALFAFIRMVSHQPVLDVVRLVSYRSDFYGKPMSRIVHEAMRGSSQWSIGDRELMAAFVAKAIRCDFCVKAHSAVAERALGDVCLVASALCEPETAKIGQPLRATLLMLRKLAREQTVTPGDMQTVLAAGASRQQIQDALAVSFSFNVMGRLASAFGFTIPGPEAFDAGAKHLLRRGYR